MSADTTEAADDESITRELLADALAEVKRYALENRVLRERINSLLSEKSEHIRVIRSLRKRLGPA